MKVKQLAMIMLIMCMILTGCMGGGKESRSSAFTRTDGQSGCRNEETFREPSAGRFADGV